MDGERPTKPAERLSELAESLRHLPFARKAARLRQLWPAIEAELAEGHSHAEVLAFLNDNGFALTERTYKSYLYRFRKRRREQSVTASGKEAHAAPAKATVVLFRELHTVTQPAGTGMVGTRTDLPGGPQP